MMFLVLLVTGIGSSSSRGSSCLSEFEFEFEVSEVIRESLALEIRLNALLEAWLLGLEYSGLFRWIPLASRSF